MHFLAALMNRSIIEKKVVKRWWKAKDAALEALGRVEVAEIEVERLKRVLAKVEANLASKKGKRKAQAMKAKKKIG